MEYLPYLPRHALAVTPPAKPDGVGAPRSREGKAQLVTVVFVCSLHIEHCSLHIEHCSLNLPTLPNLFSPILSLIYLDSFQLHPTYLRD